MSHFGIFDWLHVHNFVIKYVESLHGERIDVMSFAFFVFVGARGEPETNLICTDITPRGGVILKAGLMDWIKHELDCGLTFGTTFDKYTLDISNLAI